MIDPKHVINLKGKEHVLYTGLLDMAHKAGLLSIEVNLLQYPSPENGHLAISQATANFPDGRYFTELGDAGPQNCSGMIAAAVVRMSATRAKGRALRDALNIGVAMFEELGPEPDETPSRTHHVAAVRVSFPKREAEAVGRSPLAGETLPSPVCSVCGEPVDDLIAGKALKRWKQIFCQQHGREKSQAEAQAAVNAATGKEEGVV